MTGDGPFSGRRFSTIEDRRRRPGPGGFLSPIAFIVLFLLFIVAMNGWLLTTELIGKQYLRSALGDLTEVDRLIVASQDELAALAEEDPDGTLRLAGFPIPVEIPAEVAAAGPDEIRDYLLVRAADSLYHEGGDAFLAEDEDSGPDLSASGAVRRTLSLVGEGLHRAFLVAMVLFGLPALLVGLGMIFGRGSIASGLRALGLSIAIAAGLACVAALLLRGLATAAMSADEYLVSLLLEIISDALVLLFRTAAVFAVAGVVLAAAMLVFDPERARA